MITKSVRNGVINLRNLRIFYSELAHKKLITIAKMLWVALDNQKLKLEVT
jgi:hypothetical protein